MAKAQTADSTSPLEIDLARFRKETMGAPPTRLDGPARRALLVSQFVKAIEANDTAAVARLHLSRSEFAYLYYPSSQYTKTPYRQKPSVLWLLMTLASEKGIGRVLERDGGTALGVVGHRCAHRPEMHVRNRVWTQCVLLVKRDGKTIERRLFGSILERDGRFKFLGYTSAY